MGVDLDIKLEFSLAQLSEGHDLENMTNVHDDAAVCLSPDLLPHAPDIRVIVPNVMLAFHMSIRHTSHHAFDLIITPHHILRRDFLIGHINLNDLLGLLDLPFDQVRYDFGIEIGTNPGVVAEYAGELEWRDLCFWYERRQQFMNWCNSFTGDSGDERK